jgi:type II secretory pathway pseudopilin PulG
MVALLVALSIMAVLMTAAMPTWRQAAQREKEAELIFRGQQYARAIGLFQKKSGPGVLPPTIDALVDGHYLRKKYKDPITKEDFDVLSATQSTTVGGRGAAPAGGGQSGRGTAPPASGGTTPGQAGVARGGVMGVASKSKDASIRIYNGRTHYNEWQFVYVAQTTAPGQGSAPGGQPQRGGQSSGPGGVLGGGVGGGRDGGRGRGGPGNGPPAGRGNPPPPSGQGPGGFPQPRR